MFIVVLYACCVDFAVLKLLELMAFVEPFSGWLPVPRDLTDLTPAMSVVPFHYKYHLPTAVLCELSLDFRQETVL